MFLSVHVSMYELLDAPTWTISNCLIWCDLAAACTANDGDKWDT